MGDVARERAERHQKPHDANGKEKKGRDQEWRQHDR